jgi:hypothetical protein
MRAIVLVLLLLATPAWASEPGEVTFAISEYSCPDAPSVAADCPDHLQATNPGDTGEIAGFVRVVMDDGYTFSTAYGNRSKVGLALVMTAAPACKQLKSREGGARMYESSLAATGFPAMVDGMSLGDELSARLAAHYGMDNPRMLPVLRSVVDTVPLGLVDGRGTRLATERTVRFVIEWVEGCE